MDRQSQIYYVAIGASAGGLEAIEKFFINMRADVDLIFIVIQHLSPNHKSLMNELLARHTKMPIHVIEDDMQTQPGNIYLIPPRKNLSIFHGKLFLEEIDQKKKLNLPIDRFFRSLAIDQEEHAIGIILSGTGTDGTLGIRAIKEKGGLLCVQSEESAKFDGMPLSSISTGLVDFILHPEKMPQAIIDFIGHPNQKIAKGTPLTDDMDLLTKITLIIRDYSGTDFSYYKENTILRRLERRMMINQTASIGEYIEILRDSDKEKETLYREILIGVTSFFRDSEAFEVLSKLIIPRLHYEKRLIRIWVAGCSTGEEVYSIAILVHQYIKANKLDCELKIFATDIDRYAIETAAAGFYSDSVTADIDPSLLSSYFKRKESGYQIKESIRKTIVFASHNVIKAPPFSKLDMIVCRNLFIYFKPEIQQKLLSRFYFSLKSEGYLFLGSSESLGDMEQAFKTINTKWKIYQAKQGYRAPLVKDLDIAPARSTLSSAGEGSVSSVNSARMEKILMAAMNTTMPPSVILDKNDDIIHVINDVNAFLSYRSGRFSNNIYANVTKELGAFIGNVLRKLKNSEMEVMLSHITGLSRNEGSILSIYGYRLLDSYPEYYLLCFETDISRKKPDAEHLNFDLQTNEQIKQLETELQLTRESLQATVEELESLNEELQSSNEELIASNEELQSTNEELQSVNEELYTVNNEYQLKIDELTESNDDLNNLLNNLDGGALYLDHKLSIRKLTPIVTKITNIRESDIGRPVSHIELFSKQINFAEDVFYVSEHLKTVEREIVDDNGTPWLLRIKPYRTEQSAVSGIITTINNITHYRQETQKTATANERLNRVMDLAQIAWWEWDIETGHVLYDDLKATMLGYTPDEFPNDVYEICDLIHPDDYDKTMQIMKDHLEGKTEIWDATYRIRCKNGTYKVYHDQGKVQTWTQDGKPCYAKGSVIDVMELARSDERRVYGS